MRSAELPYGPPRDRWGGSISTWTARTGTACGIGRTCANAGDRAWWSLAACHGVARGGEVGVVRRDVDRSRGTRQLIHCNGAAVGDQQVECHGGVVVTARMLLGAEPVCLG